MHPLYGPLDTLTALTNLTVLHLAGTYAPMRTLSEASAAAEQSTSLPPLPPQLALLTALRKLCCQGFSAPSARELRSLLSPLTELADLRADLVVGAGCGLPELPSLQILHVEQLTEGGLLQLAASCTALTDLVARKPVCIGPTDAAARLPALSSLTCEIDDETISAVRAGRLSLAACLPALKTMRVSCAELLDGSFLAPFLKGMSALHSLTAGGALTAVTEWQALAALPSLRSFEAKVSLKTGDALCTFASLCAQLTRLTLTSEMPSDELDGCVAFAGAMEGSRVQSFALIPQSGAKPVLPMPFFEHLAAWRCLKFVDLGFCCTTEQLSVLCASPTIVHLSVEACQSGTAMEEGWAARFVGRLEEEHRAKGLEILGTWIGLQ
jgi:hypothetical protein